MQRAPNLDSTILGVPRQLKGCVAQCAGHYCPSQNCGCSSVGRAPPCQGGRREFEPRHPLWFLPVHGAFARPVAIRPGGKQRRFSETVNGRDSTLGRHPFARHDDDLAAILPDQLADVVQQIVRLRIDEIAQLRLTG